LTKEQRVTVVIVKSDTLIQFKLDDARIILTNVLEKEVLDSLVAEYHISDSLKDVRINLQDSVIKDLTQKSNTQDDIIKYTNEINLNKNKEIGILNNVIKQQKKEIRKQKTLKIIGFTAAVVLPILVLIL